MQTKEEINKLSNYRAKSGGTSLITYLINGNTNLWLATEKLTVELGTAKNIRARTVRNDVEDALKSALYQLKNFGNTAPENGLVLLSGTVENNSCL